MARILVYTLFDSPEAVAGTHSHKTSDDCSITQPDLSLRWSHKFCGSFVMCLLVRPHVTQTFFSSVKGEDLSNKTDVTLNNCLLMLTVQRRCIVCQGLCVHSFRVIGRLRYVIVAFLGHFYTMFLFTACFTCLIVYCRCA